MPVMPVLTGNTYLKVDGIAGTVSAGGYTGLLPVLEFSFDAIQTINVGAQPTGAGAGKVTFDPFSVMRWVDVHSPAFFLRVCNGQTFTNVQLLQVTPGATTPWLVITMKLVELKTYSVAESDSAPKESLTFECGSLVMTYHPQSSDPAGTPTATGGWNRVTNMADDQIPSPS